MKNKTNTPTKDNDPITDDPITDQIIAAAQEIAEKRASLQRTMREAILADDLGTVINQACELVGIEEETLKSLPQIFAIIQQGAAEIGSPVQSGEEIEASR